ncbi:hypothetical protein V5O48_005940 [Marasmius crinis-equi]|uniref:Uncharacterized protein n=1 Tax=Marasmius crinis-equi TaxID=585013 RepID=A0ABR3FKV6_9AGAR
MRFSALFTACTTALAVASGAFAASATAEASLSAKLGTNLNAANHYGAPIPPWEAGCVPGWYYGNKKDLLKIVIPWLKDNIICVLLDLLHLGIKCPHKPPPGDGWKQTFSGYDGAIQADDYLTFGLVDTVDAYHDVNGKDGSPLLTCALFAQCHNEDQATNKGGQSQPDGSINYIADSAGYCKN